MSEETTTNQPSTDKNVSTPSANDTIIKEAVTNALNEVVPKLREEFKSKSQTETTGLSPEQVQAMLAEDRARLADQISGRKAEPEVDPILSSFVSNPGRLLEQVRELNRQDTQAMLQEREESERATRQTEAEMKKAFDEVVSPRADITSSDATKQVWLSCFQGTDEAKPQAERMREATVKFDQLMDSVGADRTKLSSIASVTGGTGVLPSAMAVEKSREESDREYQREKHAAWSKAMGFD